MKILEIGSYPPPNNGWSVRIKYLKEGFVERGDDCKVLNLGRHRKKKSPEYIDVQNGLDYLIKLIRYRFRGYHFHIHMNGQAVKGPILALLAQLVSLLSGERAALTFHGGIEQLYFPKRNAGKMFGIIYLNFLLSKLIICNNLPIKNEMVDYGPFIKKDKIHPIPAFSVQYLNYKTVKLPDRIESFIEKKKHIILCYIVLRNGFFVDTTIECLNQYPDDVGFILCGVAEPEDAEVTDAFEMLKKLESAGTVLTVDDLSHDTFMTLLKQCSLYLRTPVSDGVASSVLEALTQGVPVVASENGRRPRGVITYDPENAIELIDRINHTLANGEYLRRHLIKPKIEDTLKTEMNAITSVFTNAIVAKV